MTRSWYLFLSLGIYSLSYANTQLIHKALTVVPIADLLGNPISELQRTSQTKKAYNQLPLCGGTTNASVSCPRIHQLLFNEIVEIISRRGDEVHIKISNFYYINSAHKTPQHSYWTHKSNLISFKELKSNKVDFKKIPPSISFLKPNHEQCQVVTLALPFYDKITQQTYSAGTRFVIDQQAKRSGESVVVYIFDRKSFLFKEVAIPNEYLITKYPESNTEKIATFVHIIKKWAHQKDGFIPYVWGGCSFAAASTSNFTEETKRIGTTQTSFYDLADYGHTPKSGFDCSGLIGRAAQICGLPYYLKNTTTIAAGLQQLKAHDQIEDGDLIWIPLHIMIVSDVKNNTLVEARSYPHGYGKIQELPLNKVFEGINTYQDLIDAYRNKKTIYRITSEGHIADSIPNFKILKLASIWD